MSAEWCDHVLQTRDIQAVQQMAAVAPPRKQAEMNGEVVAKLHLVEKHIRKNKLQVRTYGPSATP